MKEKQGKEYLKILKSGCCQRAGGGDDWEQSPWGAGYFMSWARGFHTDCDFSKHLPSWKFVFYAYVFYGCFLYFKAKV